MPTTTIRSLAAAVALLAGALAWAAGTRQEPLAGQFAGTESCKDCHKEQYNAFIKSHHRKYVQKATPATVIGDFTTNNVLAAGGRETRMVRRGDAFFVRTSGPDGKLHDYRCELTIGHYYKQRYETTLADGRRYVLPVQWNKNEKRWKDYHGLAAAKPGSGGYWCDPGRAVAVRCAGCHGTGVRLVRATPAAPPKIAEAEFTIGCEACHGPCAAHGKDEKNPVLIKAISLKSLPPRRQVDLCGKCHSRGKDPEAGTAYPYGFRPGDRVVRTFELVEPAIGKKTANFWPDGRALKHHQQFTEFVQSAHFVKAGLTCLACHTAHERTHEGMVALKPGDKPNGLCTRCHTDLRGDDALKAHTFHDPAKEGARCVACHMPKLVSNEQPMQLHHHGASIPNPRKTLLWRAPNACSLCHNDPAKNDSPQRMIDAMAKWGIPPRTIRLKPEK